MKLKLRQGAIDLSDPDFGIPAIEEIEDAFRRAISETIAWAFDSENEQAANIFFPIEWAAGGEDGIGGTVPTDPLTVYLTVPLGPQGTVDEPTYAFSLRECLQHSIETCADDGSFSLGLGKLSAAMRVLADDIDSAIAVARAKGRLEE